MFKKFLQMVFCVLLVVNFFVPAVFADEFRNQQYWLSQHKILQAQTLAKGAGVKIAVIDSGIDVNHPDLQGVVVGGTDVSGVGNSSGTLFVGDKPEHGTLVASLIAGRGHSTVEDLALAERLNSQLSEDVRMKSPVVAKRSGGILGSAPEAELLSISAWLGADVPDNVVSVEEQISKAIYWAVDNGANIINMSLGGSSPAWPQSWDKAFMYAEEKNVLIVVAAGNGVGDSGNIAAPATIPGVLAVAGVDEKDKISLEGSSQGITIGIAAASERLLGALPGGGYGQWAGTSGSAAIVSGVAGLIKSKFVGIDANNIINRLLKTAQGVEGQVLPNLSYGYGVLQAYKALEVELESVVENPLGSITSWVQLYRRNSVVEGSYGRLDSSFEGNKDGFVSNVVPVPVGVAYGGSSRVVPVVVFGFFGLVFFVAFLFGSINIRQARKVDGSPRS